MLYSILSKKGNIELKDVKSIGELLSEYISNAEMNPSIKYHREWPLIAGKSLRSVTSFASIDGHTISVYAKGAAAKNRLMLEKGRIIKDFNSRYPEVLIDDMKILRIQ